MIDALQQTFNIEGGVVWIDTVEQLTIGNITFIVTKESKFKCNTTAIPAHVDVSVNVDVGMGIGIAITVFEQTEQTMISISNKWTNFLVCCMWQGRNSCKLRLY